MISLFILILFRESTHSTCMLYCANVEMRRDFFGNVPVLVYVRSLKCQWYALYSAILILFPNRNVMQIQHCILDVRRWSCAKCTRICYEATIRLLE